MHSCMAVECGGAMSSNENGAGADSAYRSATDRYVRNEKIGEGSYGKVYKCLDRVTNTCVAMKIISWNSRDEGVPASAIREVSLLRELQHPNVIRLLDIIPNDAKLHLIFEYLDKDLKRMLDQRATPIMGMKLKNIMYQLLASLHACHRQRIVHRDIKPNNILVSRDERTVKLADFGLGRAFCLPLQTYTNEVMTLYYRAPEILLGEGRYLPSVDIWSLGCVFAELALGKPLFQGEGEFTQLITIFQVMGTPTEELWPGVSQLPHYNTEFPKWGPTSLAIRVPTLDPEGVDLLSHMLRYDPTERISAFDALHHSWFDDVRAENEARLRQGLASM